MNQTVDIVAVKVFIQQASHLSPLVTIIDYTRFELVAMSLVNSLVRYSPLYSIMHYFFLKMQVPTMS